MIKYLTIIVLVLVSAYGLRGALSLIAGPSLHIISPVDNASLHDGIVSIQGSAPRADQVTLNNSPVLRKEDGSFSLTLSFPRGGSILTFVATDRFGRRVTETRSIFVP